MRKRPQPGDPCCSLTWHGTLSVGKAPGARRTPCAAQQRAEPDAKARRARQGSTHTRSKAHSVRRAAAGGARCEGFALAKRAHMRGPERDRSATSLPGPPGFGEHPSRPGARAAGDTPAPPAELRGLAPPARPLRGALPGALPTRGIRRLRRLNYAAGYRRPLRGALPGALLPPAAVAVLVARPGGAVNGLELLEAAPRTHGDTGQR